MRFKIMRRKQNLASVLGIQKDFNKGYWNPKRKLEVTIHFSEIIKLQFGKECHTLLCILALFRIIVS